MSSEERNQRSRKEHSELSDTEEYPTDTDGKLHIRQLTHDECFEMVHNGGRLLSDEYRSKYFPFVTKNRHQLFAFSIPNLELSVGRKRNCCKELYRCDAFYKIFQIEL